MIDCHAHIDDEKFAGAQEGVVSRAKENGINKIICVGTDFETNKEVFALANEFENVYACIGLYPEYADSFNEEIINQIREMAKSNKVVAIGEIGLDFHEGKENEQAQVYAFKKQIELAFELKLPIEIHTRDAMQKTVEVLKSCAGKLVYGGIVHCYSGSLETAKELIKLGLKISFGGSLTFKNAVNLQAVAKELPLGDIVLETDCPYLAPVPVRGTVNEPANVRYVCDFLAKLRGVSYEEIAMATEVNSKEVFKI